MSSVTLQLTALAAAQHGVVLRSQAIEAGFSAEEIRRQLRSKAWLAIRRGAYVVASRWNTMSRDERHRALCYAVMSKVGPNVAVSHTSAITMYGLPTWGHDLGAVHISRANVSRSAAGVVHHRTVVPPEQVTRVGDLAVTEINRALVETALISRYEACVSTADAALREGLTTKEDLLATTNAMRAWPGARNAGRVVAFADQRSESVGESRARIAFYLGGLPEPRLQHEIRDRSGWLVARVDFLFEEYRTIAEFDGKVKYTGELTPGTDPTDALWREKKREDRLRTLGFEVVRITWTELGNPNALAAKVRAAFQRAQLQKGKHSYATSRS